jgi:hypothetical protein
VTDRRYRAILIGNSRFAKDPSLAALEGPANDVPLMFSVLTHATAGLFAPEDVRRLPERTIHELRLEIERFFAEAKSTDVLVFYYSGHGLRSTSNQLFLCANDTEVDYLNSTAIGSTWLNDTMANSASSTIVVVLDCCHSGAFKGGGEAPLPAGRFVLMSSRPSELATDTTDPNRPSLFTSHLAEGLAGAAAAHAEITVDDVYQYAYDRIVGYGRQHPQFHGKGQGRLIIARGTPLAPAPAADETPLRLSVAEIRFPEPFPPGRRPPIKRVFVQGGSAAWVADSPTGWVTVTAGDGHFDVSLDPPPGDHVAYVYVHDRASTAVIELPIEIAVHAAEPVAPAATASAEKAPATVPTPRPADDRASTSPQADTADRSGALQRAGAALQQFRDRAATTFDTTPLPAEQIRPHVAGWIRAGNVPDLVLDPPPANGALLRARTNAGVAAAERTIAFLHIGAYQGVLFTDTAVYWSDNYASSACRYANFRGKTFDSPTATHVTFGDGVPRPVGARHAKPLANLLNGLVDYVRRNTITGI